MCTAGGGARGDRCAELCHAAGRRERSGSRLVPRRIRTPVPAQQAHQRAATGGARLDPVEPNSAESDYICTDDSDPDRDRASGGRTRPRGSDCGSAIRGPTRGSRKRREDRWERDVRALGELLSAELPDRASAARRDQSLLNGVHQRLETATGTYAEHRDEMIRELELRANESVALYRSLAITRIKWLVNRISDIDPDDVRLRELLSQAESYSLHGYFCTMWVPVSKAFNEEMFAKAWILEGEMVNKLIKLANDLARGRPPRKSSIVRHWIQAVNVRRIRFRTKHQASSTPS